MQRVYPIPAFTDNYIWLITEGQFAFVVDPGDAQPVMAILAKRNLQLAGILLTHHHIDHSGGIPDLLKIAPNIPVFGSHQSHLSTISNPVGEGDIIAIGSFQFKILEIPGHTLDHIAFYGDDILFCGDTLFSAGCGKVFEGTYPQMYQSLQKIKSCAKKTKIYCGHEYTLANLKFAEHISPHNKDILHKLSKVRSLACTLPSTLEEELKINPFLRCETAEIIEAVSQLENISVTNPEKVFQLLREQKNNFRAF